MAHDLNNTYYQLEGENVSRYDYWLYLGDISGPTAISGTSATTYSMPANPLLTYSWSITSGGHYAYITGNNTGSILTIQPYHSGQVELEVRSVTNCGPATTQTITINIDTQVCLEGHHTTSSEANKILSNANFTPIGNVSASVWCPNASTFVWTKTSGNISYWQYSSSNISLDMPSGGTLSLNVGAFNGSKQLGQRTITFYNYGSFRLGPNPTEEYFAIDLNKDLLFDIQIESLDRASKHQYLSHRGGSKIYTRNFIKGDYSLSIYRKGELLHQTRLVIGK